MNNNNFYLAVQNGRIYGLILFDEIQKLINICNKQMINIRGHEEHGIIIQHPPYLSINFKDERYNKLNNVLIHKRDIEISSCYFTHNLLIISQPGKTKPREQITVDLSSIITISSEDNDN